MAIIRRHDGVEFAIQSYRELLTPKNPTLLRREIAMLTEQHGEFIRLLKQPGGYLEAVVAREPGYLLGESVWKQLASPTNLIYCEKLADDEQCLLVIVRSGSVYLDTRLPANGIIDELASLATTRISYDIYCYGDVPLSNQAAEGKFSFDPSIVKSFTILRESLFKRLQLDPELKLLSLADATANLVNHRTPVISVVILIALIALVWMMWPKHQLTERERLLQMPPKARYELALRNKADAGLQIQAFAETLPKLYGLPGWVVTAIDYSGSSVTAMAHSLGGDATSLLLWGKQNNVGIEIRSDGIKLSVPVSVASRQLAPPFVSLQQTFATLLDRVATTLPGKAVSLQTNSSDLGYSTGNASIRFTNVSPEILILIGRELSGLPVTLSGCRATVNNGLLSGDIQLTVLGS